MQLSTKKERTLNSVYTLLGIIMSIGSSALVCVADFEEYARRVLPKYAFNFYISGAEEEQTLRDNKKAYARLVVSAQFLSSQFLLSLL